jgi:parallel beta-helix repeat protein
LSNSIDGIGFHSSTSNIVTGNNVSYNPGGGITFYSSNNNTVTNNIVSHNSLDGISVTSSSDNLISRNVIRSNSIDGVILSASTNNTISSNTIADNSVSGFALLYYSSNNVIYHNNIQNAYQVSIDPTNPICAWSYNGEGNYWSDYRGRDPDGDGIGNESYSIDRDNEDKYPLMGTFSVFYMTFKGKQYDAVIISNSTIAGFGFEIGPETGNRIIRFNVTSAGGVSGFCRIRIPVELMNYSYIVMIGQKEITPTILNISDRIFAHLYFAFTDGEQTVRIISSDTLRSYGELLNRYLELQSRLFGLNLTYYSLVNNYSLLLDDYSKLQGNYNVLNDSYQEHLLVYSESAQNLRNLTYILAFVAGILIVTVAYLSRRQRMVARLESNTLVEDKH